MKNQANKLDIKKIKKIGTECIKGNYHRIYLNNDYSETIGLKLTYWNSGKVSSAHLNGEKISNNKGSMMISSFAKIWLNVNTNKLEFKNIPENHIDGIVKYYSIAGSNIPENKIVEKIHIQAKTKKEIIEKISKANMKLKHLSEGLKSARSREKTMISIETCTYKLVLKDLENELKCVG